MITLADASTVEHFHIGHDGTPCIVWERCGVTHYGPGAGQFFVPIARDGDDGREWHHITGVNAIEFHTPAMCPHARAGQDSEPPGSDGNSGRPEHDVPLTASFDADGYDSDDYNVFGFDADGYNRDGFDADGYDSDGYDSDGYDDNGSDRYGNPRPGSLNAGDLDLGELWRSFRYSHFDTHGKQEAFKQYLQELVSDPAGIDDLDFCGNCEEPAWDEDLSPGRNGSVCICNSCLGDWSDCASCDSPYPGDELVETLDESSICDDCREQYFSYCDDCAGYYPDDDADEHAHDSDDDGCCASPQREFTVRNDGCEPLANDTRATITLPAGTISAEGLKAIRDYILLASYAAPWPAYCDATDQLRNVAYDLYKLGDLWQAKGGNFTKRLSRMAYQDHQVKLTPEILSQVGCIARDHSNAVSAEIEVTRDLNQSAEDFGNRVSCWWNSYSESRCALKTNGGFGLRSFNDYGVSGRAWVLPLRLDERGNLTPTFSTLTPDAFVVFNGYGELSGYAAPRIAGHMAGWTYRKISFSCDPMYINAENYLVAPEELAAKYTDGSLHLEVSRHSQLFRTETEKELVNA